MNRRKITYKDWLKEAQEKFGDDPKKWQFICPSCKTVQSVHDFLDAGIEKETIEKVIAFSCIGRFVEGKGCDWTLGGLFQIHELEVEFEEIDCPRFEFSDHQKTEKKAS